MQFSAYIFQSEMTKIKNFVWNYGFAGTTANDQKIESKVKKNILVDKL